MKRILCALAVTLVVPLAGYPVRAADPPRLVVQIVVDGFRADHLTRFSGHWRAGLKALLTEGAVFSRAQIPYLYTDTCAGHATISTGTLPRTHGMIADNWWDREGREDLECTEDATATAVTYDRPARLGNSARWLQVPTLAGRLRDTYPGARVVTLSLKARSAIMLAGPRAEAVTWFEDAAATFVTSSSYSATPVTHVAAALKAAPYEEALDWTWSLRDLDATYTTADAGLGERPLAGWSALFPHVLKGEKGADQRFAEQWRRSPAADASLGRLARSLIDAYGLGQRDTPDYLGISFSASDYVSHAFGPDSRELEDLVARLDDVLGELLTHLDARVGRHRYVLALTADHGFASVPSTTDGVGRIVVDDVRDRIEDTLRSRLGTAGPHVDAHYRGNFYLSRPTAQRLASDVSLVRAVQRAVATMPGVERLLYGPALTESSSDAFVRAAWLSYVPARSGDFIVVPKRRWLLSPRGTADAANHGSPYDYDNRVPLILLGAGIRPGRYEGNATPTDLAPTLASLVGVSLPRTDGRVLVDALADR